MQDLVEHIELALEEAGVFAKPARPVAMAFMDLAGYTALTEERGDRAAADLATALTTIVGRTAATYRGEAVKWLGDGVMFRFPEPARGVHGALAVVEATSPAGLPPLRPRRCRATAGSRRRAAPHGRAGPPSPACTARTRRARGR